MLENCIGKVRIDVTKSDSDHLVGLLMLRDLINELIEEAIRKGFKLRFIEAEEEGEEDVSEIYIQLCLIPLSSLQPN